jgi:tight adherence protein B
MTVLALLFTLTLAITGATWWVVQRTLASRDAVKVRDRLAGKQPTVTAAGKSQAQPLFTAEGGERQDLLPRVLSWLNVDKALQGLIDQAGVGWTSGQILLGMLVAALVAFNVCWYLAPPQIRQVGFPIAAVAAVLPILYLKRRKTKRMWAFESQFPDALQFIARAMRAGHAFSVSLEMLHKEFAEPLAGEFRRAFEEQNLGLPIDTALEKLGRRMPMLDVQFFVAAVILQKRTGGNIAEILDKLSTLIRERFKLRGQIRSISAHGRLSSLVLTCIPIAVGIMMYFVNPEHMQFFVEDEIGRMMAGGAVGFIILGYLVMSRIVKIEV